MPVRAVSAESAFIVTHLLRGVMSRGTGGSSARWGLQDITAGKTGTTDGLRDAWFIGYTPDLVVGVWVGADDGRPIGMTGSEIALPIWATVMQAAVRRAPPRPFTPPRGIVMVAVESRPAAAPARSDRASTRPSERAASRRPARSWRPRPRHPPTTSSGCCEAPALRIVNSTSTNRRWEMRTSIAHFSSGTRRRARRILFRTDRPRRIDRYIDFFGQRPRVVSPALELRSRYRAEEYSAAS